MHVGDQRIIGLEKIRADLTAVALERAGVTAVELTGFGVIQPGVKIYTHRFLSSMRFAFHAFIALPARNFAAGPCRRGSGCSPGGTALLPPAGRGGEYP